jgi:hypothetical protein
MRLWRMIAALGLVAACGGARESSVLPATVLKACAMEISCLRSPPITDGANCVASLEFGIASGLGYFGTSATELKRYLACAESAVDCTSALDCVSRHHGPDYCTAHPGLTCDGDLTVQCPGVGEPPDWAFFTTDCAGLGLHCAAAAGSASCTDGTPCDPSTLAACDVNNLVTCAATGLRASVDCSKYASGAVCRSGSSPSIAAACILAGPPCQSSAGRCSGDVDVACINGNEVSVDCTQFDSHCEPSPKGVACVPNASSCTASSPDQCQGDTLSICVNGRYIPTTCASIGLGTCQSPQGTMGATCVN